MQILVTQLEQDLRLLRDRIVLWRPPHLALDQTSGPSNGPLGERLQHLLKMMKGNGVSSLAGSLQ